MKFCKNFIYDGKDSADYRLAVVSFESEPEYSFGLEREPQRGETTKYRVAANHLGARYADVLRFSMTVIKEESVESQDKYFNNAESREILGWLTSPALPTELVTISCEDGEATYYYGLFTNATPVVANGRCYGIELEFTCSSPYGFSEKYTYICTGGSSVTIENVSDEYERPIYPCIEIVPNATGTVTISNVTIGKSVSIRCKNGDTITMDCQNLTIKDSAGILKYCDIGWDLPDTQSIWWPELIYGTNAFSIEGNAKVAITCQYPRKVGDIT